VGSDRARSHVEHFNLAVRSGAWEPFARRFTDDARMVFTNVPVGPFEGRAEILRGYQEQPPDDTMTVVSVAPVDPYTDRVQVRWDSGGPGTMLLRWQGVEVAVLEITFG
jgi:steroid delta-isomerase